MTRGGSEKLRSTKLWADFRSKTDKFLVPEVFVDIADTEESLPYRSRQRIADGCCNSLQKPEITDRSTF